MSQWYTDPNIVGLAYDAAGIFVFGVPAVLLSNREVATAGESFWDYDSGAMRRLLEQKFDTGVGSVLLVAGFFGQIIAAADYSLLAWSAATSWALLPLVLVGYLLVRKRLLARHLKLAIEIAQKKNQR